MKKIIFIILLLSIYSFGQDNRIVRQNELSDSLDAVRTLIGTGGVPLPDSVIFTSELTPYVDKTTAQTIPGEKDFTGGIKLSDTTHSIYFYNPFTANYGYYGLRSWNAWVNTDGRPDVGFGLGYNLAAGGGRVDTDDIAMGMMMESHYDGNGYTASELHLMNVGTNNVQYRFLTADFNKTTNSTGLRLNADKIFMGEDNGSIIYIMQNGFIDYYQPYFSMYPNNSSMIANWNKDSTAWVFLPYLDNNDRYTFGNIDTIAAGNPFLHFYQMGLRFDNTFGISSYNSGGTLTKNFYYDSDELRIQADTTEPVKIRASNLYFEKEDGGLIDIINPALPFDTLGLEAGERYVDATTGIVQMRIGTNLISNGDFSSWTWDASSYRHPTNWTVQNQSTDSTATYIENSSDRLHIVSDGTSLMRYYYNAASSEVGVTYIYSFNLISWSADSLAFSVGNVPINTNYVDLNEGFVTGELTPTSAQPLFSFVTLAGGTCDVLIDNLRIWKKTGGTIQTVAPIILVPDTTGITDGYAVKYVGGSVVWSPDVSTGGSGLFTPDGVTIDTTAGGLARIVPAIKNRIDSVWTKQPLDGDLTDLADGELTASKVGGVKDADYGDVTVSSGAWAVEDDSHNHVISNIDALQDSLTAKANTAWFAIAPTLIDDSIAVKMNRAEMSGYSTTSHTHTEFADTVRVASWSMGMGNTDLDTLTAGSFGGIKIENNYTITEVSAYTNSGTVTFNIEERVETTPNTTGVDVITSDLVADTDQQETSTFSNAAIDRDDWLILTIVSITGDPTIFSVTVRGVKTD